MKPLKGLRLIVTRAAHQAQAWETTFLEAGAVVSHLPLIEIVPTPPDELQPILQDTHTFDVLVFASANAVETFLPHVQPATDLQIATVGPSTSHAVGALGRAVDLEAKKPRAEGLVELLTPQVQGRRVLVPQADDARPTLVTGLREAGADVVSVVTYRKRAPVDTTEKFAAIPRDRPLWITLTSPRIVRHFVALRSRTRRGATQDHDPIRTAVIGPVTAEALRQSGQKPDAEAIVPTADAMVEAIRQAR